MDLSKSPRLSSNNKPASPASSNSSISARTGSYSVLVPAYSNSPVLLRKASPAYWGSWILEINFEISVLYTSL